MFNELHPHMEFLRMMRERMGERYPEAMFLPPVLVNEEEKGRMLRAMRVRLSLGMGLVFGQISRDATPGCRLACLTGVLLRMFGPHAGLWLFSGTVCCAHCTCKHRRNSLSS
jgi:hypothetical protein